MSEERLQNFMTMAEEQIRSVDSNTLFQSKMSVNVFKLKIYTLKIITPFVFIL